jgi:hypothetical protein
VRVCGRVSGCRGVNHHTQLNHHTTPQHTSSVVSAGGTHFGREKSAMMVSSSLPVHAARYLAWGGAGRRRTRRTHT